MTEPADPSPETDIFSPLDFPWTAEEKPAPETRHLLTVTYLDDVVEYALDHPGCRSSSSSSFYVKGDEEFVGAEAYSNVSHDCAVGFEIDQVGFFDALGVCIDDPDDDKNTGHLGQGVYEVEPWSHTYPATPNGPEEHDAGLTVTFIDPAPDSSDIDPDDEPDDDESDEDEDASPLSAIDIEEGDVDWLLTGTETIRWGTNRTHVISALRAFGESGSPSAFDGLDDGDWSWLVDVARMTTPGGRGHVADALRVERTARRVRRG